MNRLAMVIRGDITEDCCISRMTFYYHFKDIYDLVEWACACLLYTSRCV